MSQGRPSVVITTGKMFCCAGAALPAIRAGLRGERRLQNVAQEQRRENKVHPGMRVAVLLQGDLFIRSGTYACTYTNFDMAIPLIASACVGLACTHVSRAYYYITPGRYE